jgi:hypothetical protein
LPIVDGGLPWILVTDLCPKGQANSIYLSNGLKICRNSVLYKPQG